MTRFAKASTIPSLLGPGEGSGELPILGGTRIPMDFQESFAGRRCLITGGTGFIGGRLVEVLSGSLGTRVRVLVRNLAQASRVARYPVELVRGDVAEGADVERACKDVDFVFHCAYGNSGNAEAQRRVTVEGTENVLRSAGAQGAKRIVHVSTVAVYGATRDGDLDESAPRVAVGDHYADTKLEAERRVLDAARQGLAATVVQPTVVYGPWGPAWTVRILNELKTGRVILVDGGTGLCNPVYVDDVVRAMLLAAVQKEAVGEHFLVSGPAPVTWKEFYGAYERILGFTSTVSLSSAEAQRLFERWLKKGREKEFLLRVGRALIPASARRSIKERLQQASSSRAKPSGAPEKPIHPLAPVGIGLGAARTRVRIDKAVRVLGYRPAFDFPTGMARVGDWARWANMTVDGSGSRG